MNRLKPLAMPTIQNICLAAFFATATVVSAAPPTETAATTTTSEAAEPAALTQEEIDYLNEMVAIVIKESRLELMAAALACERRREAAEQAEAAVRAGHVEPAFAAGRELGSVGITSVPAAGK